MRNENENTILVTGATGTVGSEVVKQPSGQSVKAAVHTQSKADKYKHDKTVDIISIDYNKPETIVDALKGVDKVFLLTLPSPEMINIYSNLVKEAEKNKIEYIVKLSVFGADAEPRTIIGRLHRQEEKIIEESGIPYSFLRPGAFMQNFVNFFGQTIKKRNAFYLAAFVVNMDSADMIPVIAEPLFQEMGANVEFHPIMSLDDLKKGVKHLSTQ